MLAKGAVMFFVDEVTAAWVRHVFGEDGELSAVIELRRRCPLIAGDEDARSCVRAIVGRHSPSSEEPAARRVSLRLRRRFAEMS